MSKFSFKLSKSTFMRGALVAIAAAFLVSTTVAPTAQAQGIIGKLRCAAITTFGTVSLAAIELERKAMEAVFSLQLKVVQATWEIKDDIVGAVRKTKEAIFSSLVKAYRNLKINNAVEKAALDKYKIDVLAAVDLFFTDYDAVQATYREDMLAAIKQHQYDLRQALAKFTTAFKAAYTKAKTDCMKIGTLLILTGEVIRAKAEFVKDAIVAELKGLKRGLEIIRDRIRSTIDIQRIVFRTWVDVKTLLVRTLVDN
jgi:hypothetical protein